jgi:hypothetical protein
MTDHHLRPLRIRIPGCANIARPFGRDAVDR